jgi:hypothetical protein
VNPCRLQTLAVIDKRICYVAPRNVSLVCGKLDGTAGDEFRLEETTGKEKGKVDLKKHSITKANDQVLLLNQRRPTTNSPESPQSLLLLMLIRLATHPELLLCVISEIDSILAFLSASTRILQLPRLILGIILCLICSYSKTVTFHAHYPISDPPPLVPDVSCDCCADDMCDCSAAANPLSG